MKRFMVVPSGIVGMFLCLMLSAVTAQELRSDAHRTPEARFAELEDFPFEPHYIEIDGLRMHYVDEGPGDAGTFLLLHGEPTWSYLYRDWIQALTAAGYRAIAPDMIGFGKSDKVIDLEWYTVDRHVFMLKEFVKRLDLENITVVVQDWGGPTGLITAVDLPDRFARLIILNTWLHNDGYVYTTNLRRWHERSQRVNWVEAGDDQNSPLARQLDPTAYGAPFDSEDATAGASRWPWMLPFAQPEAGAAERQAAAFAALASWDKPAHVIFGDQDTTFTPEWGRQFAAHIPGATFDTVEGAGHWVQETGLRREGAGHWVQETGAPPLAELILRRISEE